MKRFNHTLERLMPILTPTGVILGLLLGAHVSWMKPAVNWLFGFLTFTSALSISMGDVGKTLKKPKVFLLFILCAIVILPVLAFLLATMIFHDQSDLVSGYILLMAIPTAVVGTIWSSIYHGDAAVSLTILLLDTVLAPFLTPAIVKIFTHTSIQIDALGMMRSLLFMVVIPSILGIAVNQLTRGKVNENVTPCLKPIGKIFLVLVIIINTSRSADTLISSASLLYIPVGLLSIFLAGIGFPISYYLSRFAKCTHEEAVSVTFASSLRNISAALVLATDYFPPLATLPVVFGIVFQQTVCALMGSWLFGKHDTIQMKEKESAHEKHS